MYGVFEMPDRPTGPRLFAGHHSGSIDQEGIVEQIRTRLGSESVAAAAGLYAADLGRCLAGHEWRVDAVPWAPLYDNDHEALRPRCEAHPGHRHCWLLHIGWL
jgi:hypothetical protein